jgi:hypothetical protein
MMVKNANHSVSGFIAAPAATSPWPSAAHAGLAQLPSLPRRDRKDESRIRSPRTNVWYQAGPSRTSQSLSGMPGQKPCNLRGAFDSSVALVLLPRLARSAWSPRPLDGRGMLLTLIDRTAVIRGVKSHDGAES